MSEVNEMQTRCKQQLPLFCIGFISFAHKNKKDETITDSIGCLSADWVLFQ